MYTSLRFGSTSMSSFCQKPGMSMESSAPGFSGLDTSYDFRPKRPVTNMTFFFEP